jgi:hypothetical protein
MEINTNHFTEELPILRYQFTIGGERGSYDVTFLISGDCLKTHCTCKHQSRPCWHIEYVLAGKTSRIVGGDMHLQSEMIKEAETTAEGRFMLRKAKKKYAQETHCRRCSSQNITKLKDSVVARVATLFRETKNHTYYCKDCKWTW